MFFALAFIAAANPKLLAIDLLLIENRRPQTMFRCLLAAGVATGVTIGLIVVLVVPAHAYHSERQASAGVDLALGLILLLIGGLVMTGILAQMWARRSRSGRLTGKKRKGHTDWAQRALREPRLGVAFLVGFICGLPGAAYLAALHNLVISKTATGTEVVAVFVFVIISFLLIIVPWLLLAIWPSGTANMLRRTLAWVTGHAMALIAWICILLGAFLTVSGIVRLLTA
jgi:phosphotransferase system  glucose/maltose/N-acetylglucosamine-specific IIC component